MEKHAIPQNIMDIEFKLFGSMTVKQFGTIAISFVLAFLVYVLGLPEIISYPIIFFTVVIGLAMAFVKVNGMPFTAYFNNFLTSLMTSQRKVYRKTSSSEKASGDDVPVPVRQSSVEPKMIKRVARPDLAGFEQKKGQLDSQLEDPLAENKVQSLDAYFSGEAVKSLGKYGIASGINAAQSSLSTPVTPQTSAAPVPTPGAVVAALPAAGGSIATPQLSSQAQITRPELTPPRVPGNFQASTAAAAVTTSPKETVTASGLKIVQKGAQTPTNVQPVVSQAQPAQPTPTAVEESLPTADAKSAVPTATAPTAAIPTAPAPTATNPTIATEVAPSASPTLASVADETEQKERLQDLMSAANVAPTVTMPASVLKPNQVAGVITDAASRPLAQVQVIVKDKPGNLLRAAYTDSKGKFLISSALPSGSYELEFIKIGYTFLAHQLELTGTQYPIYKYTAQS